jgi:RNA recognition motif-containing protein
VRIFVSNISFTTVESALFDLISAFGQVSDVMICREGSMSRGFAFIELPDSTEALRAIEGIDGAMFEGRRLHCELAKPRKPAEVSR